MHSFLIAAAFILMVLSPCAFAQCSGIFPLRLRLSWKRPAPPARDHDPLLRYARRPAPQPAAQELPRTPNRTI